MSRGFLERSYSGKMDGEDRRQTSLATVGRAEIDTKAPFRSVKEAVALFGERILVGEIYAKQIKEIQGAEENEKKPTSQSKFGALRAKLEETKQSLDQAKEETNSMEHCINSLRQELGEAKRELQKLKDKEHQKQLFMDPDNEEDLKFIATPKWIDINDEDENEKANKRSVKFASPPSLARVIIAGKDDHRQFPNRSPSLKKPKKKPLVPIFGWLFAKKKGIQQSGQSPTVDAFC